MSTLIANDMYGEMAISAKTCMVQLTVPVVAGQSLTAAPGTFPGTDPVTVGVAGTVSSGSIYPVGLSHQDRVLGIEGGATEHGQQTNTYSG